MNFKSDFVVNLALVGLSVVTVLAAGELAVRRFGFPSPPSATPAEVPEKFSGLQRLGQADLTRPNADGVYAGKRLRTNSLGFRGADVSHEKPRDVRRAVVIGDSVSMGYGVRDRETYAARIEKIWNQDSDRRYEVLNLGVSSFNSRMSIDRLEDLGLSLDPDLVIYGFTTNDLEGLPGYRETGHYSRYEEWAAIRSSLWRKVVMSWYYLRDCFYPDSSSYVYELEENYFRNPEVWNEFARDLERLQRLTADRDICLAILLHAAVEDALFLSPFPRFTERVEQLAKEKGIVAIPSRSFFRGHEQWELRAGIVDPHPSALGHDLYARALLSGIARLPESCDFPGAGGS